MQFGGRGPEEIENRVALVKEEDDYSIEDRIGEEAAKNNGFAVLDREEARGKIYERGGRDKSLKNGTSLYIVPLCDRAVGQMEQEIGFSAWLEYVGER